MYDLRKTKVNSGQSTQTEQTSAANQCVQEADHLSVIKQSLQTKEEIQKPENNTQAKVAVNAIKPAFNFSSIPVHPLAKPFIQPKLTINTPGDQYEQEADAMAEKVMRMKDTSWDQVLTTSSSLNTVNRKCSSCGDEMEDKDEESDKEDEADTLVQRMYIQRKCAKCEEEEKNQLLRKESADSKSMNSSLVNSTLQSAGHPLDKGTRSFMETRFGRDFSNIKIHDDSQAHQSAKDINALAYTHKNNIVFGAGQYQPHTESGKRLLAHELTHAVQQSGGMKAGLIQRQKTKRKDKSYQFKVPVGITTLEDWGKYLNKKIYGDENAAKWTYGLKEIHAGQIRTVTVKGESFSDEAVEAKKEAHKKKNEEFVAFSPKQKGEINKEADKRFYQETGAKEGTKIKPGEEGKAQQWNDIRDGIIDQKQKLENLPEELKQLLGGSPSFKVQDYDQLMRIAEKLKQFSPEDIAVYKLLAIRATDDLNLFEQSVDLFLSRKVELKKAMEAYQKDKSTSADSKEPASMEEAINASWKDFDASGLGTMSEKEKYSEARSRAWKVSKAQLEYMAKHPGETAVDFAKTATLANTPETFKGIAGDLKEAANGDANTFARWAGGTGAGAKLSGWLLAVGAVVYVLSWLTGIGELATIAAFMGYMLGATIVLSTAEAELRIKAASQANTPEEFQSQATKAGVAYANVLISVGMLVVALAIRFLAKTYFPNTVKSINESLARFREKVRISGGLKEILPQFESEMSGFRQKLIESGETAKKEVAAKADSIERMSTDEFVQNLERGADDFFNSAGVKDGQKVPWAELAKTPEGLKGIQEYQQSLVKELRNSVPKEIDTTVKEQTDALDRMVEKAKASTTPDEFNEAAANYEKFNSPAEVTQRGKAKEEKVTKEKTEEAIKKIDEEIKKAEAERAKAEEERIKTEEEKTRVEAEEKAAVANAQKGYGDLADYRKTNNLPEYKFEESASGTVAKAEGRGAPEFGENSSLSGKEFELRKKGFQLVKDRHPNAKQWSQANYLTHAEAHALLKAWANGTLQKVMTLVVDRPTCNMCMGGLGKLLKALGVEKVNVYSGGSTTPEVIVAE